MNEALGSLGVTFQCHEAKYNTLNYVVNSCQEGSSKSLDELTENKLASTNAFCENDGYLNKSDIVGEYKLDNYCGGIFQWLSEIVHSVTSVWIRSSSGLYFPVFEFQLNTKLYSANLGFILNAEKYRPKETLNAYTLWAVLRTENFAQSYPHHQKVF